MQNFKKIWGLPWRLVCRILGAGSLKCLKRAKGVKIFPYKRLKKIEKMSFQKNTFAQPPSVGYTPPAVVRGNITPPCSRGGIQGASIPKSRIFLSPIPKSRHDFRMIPLLISLHLPLQSQIPLKSCGINLQSRYPALKNPRSRHPANLYTPSFLGKRVKSKLFFASS